MAKSIFKIACVCTQQLIICFVCLVFVSVCRTGDGFSLESSIKCSLNAYQGNYCCNTNIILFTSAHFFCFLSCTIGCAVSLSNKKVDSINVLKINYLPVLCNGTFINQATDNKHKQKDLHLQLSDLT